MLGLAFGTGAWKSSLQGGLSFHYIFFIIFKFLPDAYISFFLKKDNISRWLKQKTRNVKIAEKSETTRLNIKIKPEWISEYAFQNILLLRYDIIAQGIRVNNLG